MNEPTELGTVVRDEYDALWVRTQQDSWPWIGWMFTHACSNKWSEIDNPTLVHEGYTPPTPEPLLHAAVVRDATGRIVTRARTGSYPWMWGDGMEGKWRDLPQPVEILFAGVES